MDTLIPIIADEGVKLIGALVLGLITVVLNLIRTKYKIDISSANEDLIMSAAQKAVLAAEEYGAHVIKKNNGMKPETLSAEKLDHAISTVIDATGIDDKGAILAVTAALGSIKGIGASKEIGQ